jgi:hypothetical protein
VKKTGNETPAVALGKDVSRDLLRQGLGRHDATVDGDEGLPKPGPQIIAVAVGSEDHSFGVYGAAGGFEAPHQAISRQAGNGRRAVHLRPGLYRHLRYAARKPEWIDVPAAPVEKRADIAARAGRFADLGSLQQVDGHATSCGLLEAAAHIARAILRDCSTQRAGLACLADDLMPRGKVENDLRRVPGQLDHAPAKVGPEVRLDLIGIVLQARIDLPAIAAGGAPPRLMDTRRSPSSGGVAMAGRAVSA